MSIVSALDIHREQVTYDWVDVDTGESGRGKIRPANGETFRRWLARFDGKPHELVVEGCTGWRFIAEECQAAGVKVHVADPAEAAHRTRSNKRRAKTDRTDARGLRQLLEDGRVPDSWIPPFQVLGVRTKVRLYHDLVEQRSSWQHRINAVLFHQGAPKEERLLLGDRSRLHASTALSPAGKRAALSVARKLARRCHHRLRELGDVAFAEA